ncbi:hypothetical protein H6758_02940 [Candidatus Nomurabacteria bacterium]|nr:hypothetical protein [Candidatus Nomurabacteria bacterium]
MKKERILILSVSAGSGHTSAAVALEQEAHAQGIDAKHIDLLELVSGKAKKLVANSYESFIKSFPTLWGFLYKNANRPSASKGLSELSKLVHIMHAKKLNDFVADYKPDRIIATHFLPAHVFSDMNKDRSISIPVDAVLTDYGVHALWAHPNMRRYFVAAESTSDELKKFVPKANTVVSGIPIRSAFYDTYSLTDLQKQLNLKDNLPTLLFLAGGHGLIPLDHYVRIAIDGISHPCNIVAIAGENAKLQASLKNLAPKQHHYQAHGWTDQMQNFMRCSDVVISKPGGITTSECITLQKPLLAIEPIPGQEIDNAQFIEQHHLGKHISQKESLADTIEKILKKDFLYSPLTYKKRPSKMIIEG